MTRALGRSPKVACSSALSERATLATASRAGDQVVVYPSRTLESEAVYTLAREAGIVAAYKPARMATIA